MCYYHPTSLLYTVSNPYQHFIRPCNQARYYATALVYPVFSSASGAAGFTGVSDAPTMQVMHGILVMPCSNHYIANETEGDSGTEERAQSERCRHSEPIENKENMLTNEREDDSDCDGDSAMKNVSFDFGFGSDSDDDDNADAGWSAEDDDEDDDEDIGNNSNTNTGLAVPVHVDVIKPGAGPSLSKISPKPQPKRFRRELLSAPVQHLRMKWKKSVVRRSLQKAAVATSAAQTEPRGPFINDGFGSWAAPVSVYQLGHGQNQVVHSGVGDSRCIHWTGYYRGS